MLYMQSTNANDGTMTETVTFDVQTDVNQNRVAQAQPFLPAEVNQNGMTIRKTVGTSLVLVAKLGLTVPEVNRAVLQQNTVNPSGKIGAEPQARGNEMTYTVRAKGRLATPEEFGRIIVCTNPDGSVVRYPHPPETLG